jgi:hypothetical protein
MIIFTVEDIVKAIIISDLWSERLQTGKPESFPEEISVQSQVETSLKK